MCVVQEGLNVARHMPATTAKVTRAMTFVRVSGLFEALWRHVLPEEGFAPLPDNAFGSNTDLN